MGKRTTTSPKGQVAKAAKVAAAPVDPLVKECAAVQAFFAEVEDSGDITTSCRKILEVAMLPALRTSKEERDAYQNTLIQSVGELFVKAEMKRKAFVDGIMRRIAALESEQAELDGAIEAAMSVVTAKEEVKKSKGAAYAVAKKAVEASRGELEAERRKKEQIADKKKDQLAEKDEYEKALIEAWEPLKTGTFDKGLKEKNNAITQMVQLLVKLGLSESLTSALAVAFKSAADARGQFASAAVEQSEAALKEHVAKLAVDSEGGDSDISAALGAIGAAEMAVQEAEAALDAICQEHIDAENDWVNADTQVFDLKAKKESFLPKSLELAAELEDAQTNLASLTSLASSFEMLQTRAGTPTPELLLAPEPAAP